MNSDYALPLVDITRRENTPNLEGGVLKDLGEAIFKEMNLRPMWFLVPKKRVGPSLVSGQVAILCHLNEVWQPKIVDDVWWSHELYRSTNLFVFIKKTKQIRSLKDLYGERVGVVLNFIYKSLDSAFQSGQIHREDGPNNESKIQKLLNGRLNYIL
ncbi:MAG: ABC transporter substrate-binding protein, partial [Bdellovibrio sp.]|nr:ABC transporter substrate-binding protein [Bdellovibrio sp.]